MALGQPVGQTADKMVMKMVNSNDIHDEAMKLAMMMRMMMMTPCGVVFDGCMRSCSVQSNSKTSPSPYLLPTVPHHDSRARY